MNNTRRQKYLYIIYFALLLIALLVLVTTHDNSLKAIIKSALFSDELSSYFKFAVICFPISLVLIIAFAFAPKKTKWLQTLISIPLGILKQKMNPRQTIVVIIFAIIYCSVSILCGSQLSTFAGRFLSTIWFITLVIPLHFLRSQI
jgi:hypothetical protein